jgi:hypothetical protein
MTESRPAEEAAASLAVYENTLSELATLTTRAVLTGWASAVAERAPLAARAATAKTGAQNAMVSLEVIVRFSSRCEDNVNFRPGTQSVLNCHPVTCQA